MLKALLGKVNKKKLILTVVVLFAYVFISDFIIHGLVLGQSYKETAHLWRSEEEMKSYMIWMLVGQFLIAKFLAVLYARGYEGKGSGAMEGFRFGILIGALAIAPMFVQYAVTPLPSSILWAWVILGYVQTVGAGSVAGMVYRPKR